MGGTYYDAVLTDRMHPVFNGTPEETVKWLEEHNAINTPGLQVCRGIDMVTVSVDAYLTADKERKEAAIVDKRARVHQLVAAAMRSQDTATYHGVSSDGMDIVAKDTTDAIIKLFI